MGEAKEAQDKAQEIEKLRQQEQRDFEHQKRVQELEAMRKHAHDAEEKAKESEKARQRERRDYEQKLQIAQKEKDWAQKRCTNGHVLSDYHVQDGGPCSIC